MDLLEEQLQPKTNENTKYCAYILCELLDMYSILNIPMSCMQVSYIYVHIYLINYTFSEEESWLEAAIKCSDITSVGGRRAILYMP